MKVRYDYDKDYSLTKIGLSPMLIGFIQKIESSVIDLGCGTRVPKMITTGKLLFHGTYYGVDTSRTALTQVKKDCDPRVIPVLADIGNLPFKADQFDYAICWRIISNCRWKELPTRISEISRVLKKSGQAMVNVHSFTEKNITNLRRFDQYRELGDNCFYLTKGRNFTYRVYMTTEDIHRYFREFKLGQIVLVEESSGAKGIKIVNEYFAFLIQKGG